MTPNMGQRTAALLLLALLLSPVRGSAQNDPAAQIDLTLAGTAPRPTDGVSAANTIFARQQAAIGFLACGQELEFLAMVRSAGPKVADTSTGDAVNMSVAKMYWLSGLMDAGGKQRLTNANTTCRQQVLFDFNVPKPAHSFPPDDAVAPPFDGTIVKYSDIRFMADTLGDLTGKGLNVAFGRTFGDACNGVISSVTANADKTRYTVGFSVTPVCLRLQLNFALKLVYVTGQMGTGKGMPCHVFGSLADSDGNWDFSMRSLMRALYLDRLYTKYRGQRQFLLTPDVRAYIQEKLIITGINLGEEDYPITGCGNTEHAEGDPNSRVDDGNFLDDVGHAFGDFLDWLLKHWYVVDPALVPLLAGADPIVIAIVTAAAAANTLIQVTRIPETENHRLMIESTRYLNNQLLRSDLADDSGRLDTLNSAQKDVHDWLLQRLQSILLTDFTEYNARPYQRESIGAVMNLYDFAEDPEMSAAAHLALEYAFAKFAIGSNQGRRLVPFRRHMDDVLSHIIANDNVMYTGQEADHQEALGLLYTGQTQQLGGGFAPTVFPAEAAFGAFSWYAPNKLVLDLAVDKSTPYVQRFRHGGAEVYSSGKGFLITAGGVITDYAYSVLGMGIAADKGAAVPTTIMFPSGIWKATMWSFLQFQGLYLNVQGAFPGSDPATSFEHNLCVTRGFACGLNPFVPDDIKACLTPGPANREPYWFFFDSSTCPGYNTGPPVYVVLYKRPCLAAAQNCNEVGFLEAVDVAGAPTPATFAAFQTNVLLRNPPGLIKDPPPMVAGGGGLADAVPLPSTYNTTDGRKIEFDPTAHILDSDKTGITAINGAAQKDWGDWGTAEGETYPGGGPASGPPLVTKNDWPLVTITNPRFPGQAVTLDFRGWGVAKYDGP